MRLFPALAALLLFLNLPALAPLAAQTAAPAATNAPAATTNAVAVALPDVVTQSVTDSDKLQQMQAQLTADATASGIEQSLPALAQQIDQRERDDAGLLAGNPSLPQLRSDQAAWQALDDSLASSRQALTARLALLDGWVAQLGQMHTEWQATQKQSTGAPGEVMGRISALVTAIGNTTSAVSASRARLLLLQNKVVEQSSRIRAGVAALKAQQDKAVDQLFRRDSAPLWEIGGAAIPVGAAGKTGAQLTALRTYVLDKFPTFFLHLGLFLILAVALYAGRSELRRRFADDPDIQRAAVVFEVPLATALVLALLAGAWLYPLPPPLFQALLGALAIVPVIVLLRRLVAPDFYPVLYALLLAYFVDHVRLVVEGSRTGRILFLAEMIAGILFLIRLLRSGKLLARGNGDPAALGGYGRLFARAAVAILAASIVANVCGYLRLSYLLGNGLLRSADLLLILYAAVNIADGLVLGALKLPPFSLLRMAQNHYPLLRRRVARVLRVAAFLVWALETLELFSVRSWLWKKTWLVLDASATYGKAQFSLGGFLLFGLIVWATFLLSRFLRFILEEEVYPTLRLAPGVPYATSTLVHYVVLVVGVLFALPAIHVDLSQYAVLGGAIGVGLGFGLQNIMNNFVSGLILLFERPVKVGDVIQVDVNVGTVERIGIRASVIRLNNGSEYIVPNGNLISNPVFNWTFSNRQRIVDLPIAVAAKTDPQQVMTILVDTAKANPFVLKDPAPQVLITTLSGASLSLQLRAWTDNSENWMQLRSDLALAISSALARENITMV